jgi:hypothetical protein
VTSPSAFGDGRAYFAGIRAHTHGGISKNLSLRLRDGEYAWHKDSEWLAAFLVRLGHPDGHQRPGIEVRHG